MLQFYEIANRLGCRNQKKIYMKVNGEIFGDSWGALVDIVDSLEPMAQNRETKATDDLLQLILCNLIAY